MKKLMVLTLTLALIAAMAVTTAIAIEYRADFKTNLEVLEVPNVTAMTFRRAMGTSATNDPYNWLSVGTSDGRLMVWRIDLWEPAVKLWERDVKTRVDDIAIPETGSFYLLPADNVYVGGAKNYNIRGRHLDNGLYLTAYKMTKKHTDQIHSIAFAQYHGDPGNERRPLLASGSADGTVRIWQVYSANHELVRTIPIGAPVRKVAWSPDGRILAIRVNNNVELWDPHTSTKLATHRRLDIDDMAWHPSENRIAVLGWELAEHLKDTNVIEIWNVENPNIPELVRRERRIEITANRDEWATEIKWQFGKYLLGPLMTSNGPNGFASWDANTGEKKYNGLGHPIFGEPWALSPTGLILASYDRDNQKIRLSWSRVQSLLPGVPIAVPKILTTREKYETHAKLIDGLTLKGANNPDLEIDDRPLPNKGGNAFIPLQQPTKDTCGPTSLEMVLHYYGKKVTMADIFREGGIHTVYIGTTPSEMKQALNRLGVPARYHDEDTTDYGSYPLEHLRSYIDQNRLPCILIRVSTGYHWVVVVGYYKNDEFLLADPGFNHQDGSGNFIWVDSDNLKNAWNFERDLKGGRTSFSRGFNYGKDLDWLDLAAIAIDPYTIIVPDDAPDKDAHFPGMWSEMKSFRITGTDKLFGKIRGWEKTLDFNHKFDDYRAAGIPELISPGLFGLPKFLLPGTAELHHAEPVGEKSLKLWGSIEDGWKIRGRMQVTVRTYRYSKPPAAPAQTVSTQLSASPAETSLLPNYPNPFNPETWIPYQLAKPAEVNVRIYSADGKLVRRLDLGQMPSGVYRSRARAAYWNGRNAQGEPVASGVYFYTLTAGEFSATRKMVIRK